MFVSLNRLIFALLIGLTFCAPAWAQQSQQNQLLGLLEKQVLERDSKPGMTLRAQPGIESSLLKLAENDSLSPQVRANAVASLNQLSDQPAWIARLNALAKNSRPALAALSKSTAENIARRVSLKRRLTTSTTITVEAADFEQLELLLRDPVEYKTSLRVRLRCVDTLRAHGWSRADLLSSLCSRPNTPKSLRQKLMGFLFERQPQAFADLATKLFDAGDPLILENISQFGAKLPQTLLTKLLDYKGSRRRDIDLAICRIYSTRRWLQATQRIKGIAGDANTAMQTRIAAFSALYSRGIIDSNSALEWLRKRADENNGLARSLIINEFDQLPEKSLARWLHATLTGRDNIHVDLAHEIIFAHKLRGFGADLRRYLDRELVSIDRHCFTIKILCQDSEVESRSFIFRNYIQKRLINDPNSRVVRRVAIENYQISGAVRGEKETFFELARRKDWRVSVAAIRAIRNWLKKSSAALNFKDRDALRKIVTNRLCNSEAPRLERLTLLRIFESGLCPTDRFYKQIVTLASQRDLEQNRHIIAILHKFGHKDAVPLLFDFMQTSRDRHIRLQCAALLQQWLPQKDLAAEISTPEKIDIDASQLERRNQVRKWRDWWTKHSSKIKLTCEDSYH